MYYPGLPASSAPITYCADVLAHPRLIDRYNASSLGYLVS